MSRCDVVIVNYRTGGLVVDCLRSLAADGYVPRAGRVIVVDNASGDDSVEMIGQAIAANGWSQWVELIPAQRNGGFAYGNNIGIRRAVEGPDKPQYLLLLNPDTVVRPGAIETLVRFMEKHPKAGITGANMVDRAGRPLHCAHRFPSPLQQFEEGVRMGIVSRWLGATSVTPGCSEDVQCDWVSGACMIVRQQVFERVGLMDEGFFLYFEEVDFCRRTKSAGWQAWYLADASVVHLVGASTEVNAKGKRRPRYWYESRRRYFRKHHGRVGAVLADVACCAGVWLFRARRLVRITRRTDLTPRGFLRDIVFCGLRGG